MRLRQELKAKFIQELTPSEKFFFLKKAEEVITRRGYRAGEDLFHFCYFSTLKERIRSISPSVCNGHLRFMLVETSRDVDEMLREYEEKLEKKKQPSPDQRGAAFIEYFSG